MKQLLYISLSMLFVMSSCRTSQKTTRYTIASSQSDCVGVAPQKCLLIKKENSTGWENFYSRIEGFDYQEGNEYVLEVREENRVNVPADASSVRYILVKEVSKTAKTSTDLPASLRTQGYQCVGRVLLIEKVDVGRGGASGKISATVVKVQLTSSASDKLKEGDTIHCELVSSPTATPVAGREYVFKAKLMHPAHAKGVYLLETDVMDLVN